MKRSSGEQDDEKLIRWASVGLVLLVLLIFAAIMVAAYFIERRYGKAAGTVCLCVLAAVIAVLMYRKEIVARLRRRK